MLNLEMREDLGDNQGSDNPGGNENPGGDDSDDPGEGGLDRNNLEDGIYAVTGSMVKIDKTTASMSNEAINHTIKLTVKDGKYYLTMDFQGLKINSQFGYLVTLQYFLSGYTLDQYGSPQGALKEVTIDAYQTDENGNRVKDNYGTDYPDLVTFELIPEALKDGYVPLQVFVPIMEAIADGTGTQPVFLKLDWSTLKKTSADDPAFQEDPDNNHNNDNNNNGNNNNGNGLGNNTLGTGTSGLKSSGSSLTGGSSGLKSSGSSGLSSSGGSTGASSLKASSVKTADEAPLGGPAGVVCRLRGSGLVWQTQGEKPLEKASPKARQRKFECLPKGRPKQENRKTARRAFAPWLDTKKESKSNRPCVFLLYLWGGDSGRLFGSFLLVPLAGQ